MSPTANYHCPQCDHELREKVRNLMYACGRCSTVVVEIGGERRVTT